MTTLIEIGSIGTLNLISTGAVEGPLVASTSAGAIVLIKIGGAIVLVGAAALLAHRLAKVLGDAAEKKLAEADA